MSSYRIYVDRFDPVIPYFQEALLIAVTLIKSLDQCHGLGPAPGPVLGALRLRYGKQGTRHKGELRPQATIHN